MNERAELEAEAERERQDDQEWCIFCHDQTTRLVTIRDPKGAKREVPMCEGCFEAWHRGFISAQAGEDYETEDYIPAKTTDEV
jgi:hypothetical protein